MPKQHLSQAVLNELMTYAPDTGVLTWRTRGVHWFNDNRLRTAEQQMRSFNGQYAGTPALNCLTVYGYLIGTIWRVNYIAHRAIWAMVHGQWPDYFIDHINGVRTDNRLVNLRAVGPVDNSRNSCIPVNNASGAIGVSWAPNAKKWRAVIGSRPRTHLGYFDSLDEAIKARKKAEGELGYHKNHGRS